MDSKAGIESRNNKPNRYVIRKYDILVLKKDTLL
jgi:hypothetical protein